jgi:hypothetical protein
VAERAQLREIAREVHTALQARGVPVPCIAGPEPGEAISYARERVVMEHDGSDTIGSPHSQRENPRARFNRSVSIALRIYARSPIAGATVHDHRGRCEELLDHVLIVLDNVLRGTRRSTWSIAGGAFEELPDLARSDVRAGALYVLRCAYDRAVQDVAWSSGAAAEEAEFGEGGVTLANVTQVTRANGPEDAPVETGCGG